MQTKTCKQCESQFTIDDEDLVFYKKMSPEFDGKVFEYPAPTFCPTCREKRRLSWRNERTVYKRKCDKTGRDIISMFSADKTDLKVYSADEWWKDDWDAMNFGRDFDFSRPFFDQYDELNRAVPKFAMNNPRTEGCEYSNNCGDCKNCYLSSIVFYGCENTHYSYWCYKAKDNCDIAFTDQCEKCYELTLSDNCYNCDFSSRLRSCRDCKFSFNLESCSNCLFCTNLNHKQYCIENEQLSKEEYEKKLDEYNFGSSEKIKEYWRKYKSMMDGLVVKYANNINCENCLGDDLRNCKNVKFNFSAVEVEGCKYSLGHEYAKNVYDSLGGSYEWVIEGINSGFGTYMWHTSAVQKSHHILYSQFCFNCHDCFGCDGLRNKSYCILNKQYSPEEYEKLLARILDHMQKTAEWGEYFPSKNSFFGYNETVANSYFPLTKEAALKQGFKWQDDLNMTEYSGETYVPKDDIADYLNDESERSKLLSGILKCAKTSRPFKVMPQELAFYLNKKLPIPRLHYDVRYQEKFGRRNPPVLYHRKCMNEGCSNEFETTYASDRPEKVYCESCYQKSII